MDQPDRADNERLEQNHFQTEKLQLDEVPISSPPHPPDQYGFPKELEDKDKLVISRIYTVRPRDGEHYYLHLLLRHVKGANSYKDVKNVDGDEYVYFNEACRWSGLLIDDMVWKYVLCEASRSNYVTLTELCATIIVHCFHLEPIYIYDRKVDIILQDLTHRTGKPALLSC